MHQTACLNKLQYWIKKVGLLKVARFYVVGKYWGGLFYILFLLSYEYFKISDEQKLPSFRPSSFHLCFLCRYLNSSQDSCSFLPVSLFALVLAFVAGWQLIEMKDMGWSNQHLANTHLRLMLWRKWLCCMCNAFRAQGSTGKFRTVMFVLCSNIDSSWFISRHSRRQCLQKGWLMEARPKWTP